MLRQEADALEELLVSRTLGHPPRLGHRTVRPRLLMLGADAGYLMPYLKTAFETTLIDGSAAALERSRKLNPECKHSKHICTDPLALHLDETFDVILVRDALQRLTTREELVAVFQVIYAHLPQDGVALIYLPQCSENADLDAITASLNRGKSNVFYLEQWRGWTTRDAKLHNSNGPKQRPSNTTKAVDKDTDHALFQPEKWRFLLAVAGIAITEQVDIAGRKAFITRRG